MTESSTAVKAPFVYRRRIHFYETDAMGIIHHAIYLYLMEEARVEMLRKYKIIDESPLDIINYPVLDAQVEYKKPLYFDDEAEIAVRVSVEKARIIFNYELSTKRFSTPVAFGKTVHIAMEMSTRKPIRVPEFIIQRLSQ
jgi:acyl-CoA thioester hydrolase